MPSVEKAELKIGVLEAELEKLHAKLEGLERNSMAMRAGVELLKREFEFHKSIKAKLRKDLDEGECTQEEFDAGMQVLVSCITMNQKLIAVNDAEGQKQGAMSLGVRAAIAILENSRDREERAKKMALAQELDELEDLREEEEELHDDDDEADEDLEPQEDVEDEAPEVAEDSPVEAEGEAPVEKAEGEFPACTHCDEPVTLSTGTGICMACTSYKNRYHRLPPEHVLENRRQKKLQAEA
jgi:Zn finger protein HypA/HybF involved in hydrogenase expression